MQKNSKGFTLIELLVVIAIIGLLSTLAVVALNSARQKSRDSKRVADIKQVQTALELYFADQNGYPTESAEIILGDTGTSKTALCTAGFTGTCGSTTVYMGLVPSSPLPADSPCTTANNKYLYNSSATSGVSSSYTIDFCLGGSVGNLISGTHTANPNGMI